jgi:hypothetical protein
MARITQATNTLTSPAWAGDFLDREHLLPGGAKLLASAFNAEDAVVVTLSGNEAIGQTAIGVTALSGPIPSGAILKSGAGEFMQLTAAAAAGATSLTVEALEVAWESGDTATYAGAVTHKTVPSGTLVGRTIAERDAGTAFGPADVDDDEIYLTAFDVSDVTTNNDVDFYRHGGLVKENFLPVFSTLSTGLKDIIRDLYTCVRGVQ